MTPRSSAPPAHFAIAPSSSDPEALTWTLVRCARLTPLTSMKEGTVLTDVAPALTDSFLFCAGHRGDRRVAYNGVVWCPLVSENEPRETDNNRFPEHCCLTGTVLESSVSMLMASNGTPWLRYAKPFRHCGLQNSVERHRASHSDTLSLTTPAPSLAQNSTQPDPSSRTPYLSARKR
jgi:hypothetical protein